MPNIFDTVAHLETAKPLSKISLLASKEDLSVQRIKGSDFFRKVSVDLSKIPSIFCGEENGPVIIDINTEGVHRTGSGYVPKLLVIRGSAAFTRAKEIKAGRITAWVGNKALAKFKLQADGMSSSDLSSKLSGLISQTYSKKTSNYSDGSYAYVRDIFPLDSYCVFTIGKEIFKQPYKVNSTTQDVSLDGKPVKVIEQYVEVPVKTLGAPVSACMSDTPLARVSNLSIGNDFITNYGAARSEANNPSYRLMMNVEEALGMYRNEVKSGLHAQVSSQYAIPSSNYAAQAQETKIACSSIDVDPNTFPIVDFFKWQDKRMRASISDRSKLVGAEKMSASAFAYVGDIGDPSTWMLPIHTVEAAQTSLSEINNVPKLARVECLAKVKAVLAESNEKKKKKRDAGPHTGLGKPATGHLKEIETKLKAALSDVKAGGPGSGRKPGFTYPDLYHHGVFNTGRLQKVSQQTHQALFHNTRKTGDKVRYVPDGKVYTVTRSGSQPAGDNSYNLQHADGTKKWTDHVGDLQPVNSLTSDDYKRYGSRYTIKVKGLSAGGPGSGRHKEFLDSPEASAYMKKNFPAHHAIMMQSLSGKKDIKAGGPGSGRKPGDVLGGFGFKKGNSIIQSKTNQIHVYHGKGPGGATQQVMLSGPNGGKQTFTHVSNPATKDAIVHAKQQPVSGLMEHMTKHWVDHITNRVKS